LQCAAMCCSVLQCVAVCCIVLQCVALCCSVCIFERVRGGNDEQVEKKLQRNATLCISMQPTCTHCNTLQLWRQRFLGSSTYEISLVQEPNTDRGSFAKETEQFMGADAYRVAKKHRMP